jgi:hypothetical protein
MGITTLGSTIIDRMITKKKIVNAAKKPKDPTNNLIGFNLDQRFNR